MLRILQGIIYTEQQLQSMLEWCLERGVHMISDEVTDLKSAILDMGLITAPSFGRQSLHRKF